VCSTSTRPRRLVLLGRLRPKTKRLGQRATHGVLADQFLVRDKLLGRLAPRVVFNFLGAMLSATLPFYA
jgi:hypothetical protein